MVTFIKRRELQKRREAYPHYKEKKKRKTKTTERSTKLQGESRDVDYLLAQYSIQLVILT